VLATILHFEGAEAIDPQLNALEVFYQAGLRSLGLVWSRPTAFGHGVPFAFPHSPDTGPGLTDAGKQLVRACNRLGIMIDLSHLNEQGFWDVAELTNAPLVATHSNAHALCASSRNLTDKQLDAIKESDGMVGLNFAVCFLREDGANDHRRAAGRARASKVTWQNVRGEGDHRNIAGGGVRLEAAGGLPAIQLR
jgi:membrane dipeptidase